MGGYGEISQLGAASGGEEEERCLLKWFKMKTKITKKKIFVHPGKVGVGV